MVMQQQKGMEGLLKPPLCGWGPGPAAQGKVRRKVRRVAFRGAVPGGEELTHMGRIEQGQSRNRTPASMLTGDVRFRLPCGWSSS